MLPDVIFVGPTKCGTTWIDAYLRTRPEVVLPEKTKETFFFDKVFSRGIEWYRAQFPDRDGIRVEVAPSLFHKPEARAALLQTAPKTKVVIMLRDPWDRAVSHYFHYRKAGEARLPLAEMAQRFPDVVEASLFHKHAQAWEEAFPGQVSYLSYAQLRTDPDGLCAALCEVMGLDYVAPPGSLSQRQVNAAAVPRNALAARMGRRSAEWLRRAGAHQVVNVLRQTRLKKLLFAGGQVEGERQAVRAQVSTLGMIAPDHAQMLDFLAARGEVRP
ncbi:sulfotransferase domain-containing protein [Rhodobacter aestuarii]|uniref:Sulfotransferase domain-containing protein n=1 Tax=Rhodobacter aestuarii TaxID=453582 RepID=A0A1N7MSQ1_9RHOB|nr:sulfotransferase domain-containing protein [Rhodobacter aestuarii]PTV96559.1 sulfotransferase domain-containing protein [Rhodobacter aestuarii]SIS89165.1 Sulfotransferase domain-containing protein [Rhodobacter aestuarii]